MSDYIEAEIWIGGRIPDRLVSGLCLAICNEEIALEWGDSTFSPATTDDLLDARRDEKGVQFLHLCDDQARWGQFDRLETFLAKYKIPFRRRSEAKYEHDAEIVEFRPKIGLVRFVTNSTGQPLVTLALVRAIGGELDKLLDPSDHSSVKSLVTKIREVRELLRKTLPPTVPPLDPFEIGGQKTKEAPSG